MGAGCFLACRWPEHASEDVAPDHGPIVASALFDRAGRVVMDDAGAPVVATGTGELPTEDARELAAALTAAADLADRWTFEVRAYEGNPCPSWCTETHRYDTACWGTENKVSLSMEEVYDPKVKAGQPQRSDAPAVTVYAYRESAAHRELARMNVYRESNNEFLNIDADVSLTAGEAIRLANHLLRCAAEIRDRRRGVIA